MRRKRFLYVLVKIRNVCLVLLVFLCFAYNMKNIQDNHIKTKLTKNAVKFIDFKEQIYINTLQVDTLKRLILKYNHEEQILNQDIYGPIRSNSPIFIIFVDKYKPHLKYLVASLQSVQGIADTLLIFSHSYFDENVNNLIKTIDFTRVLQIFYPYSLQIYPKEFPGFQPGDCTRDMDIDTAKYMNCTGAYSPDIHGRYRDPFLAQFKHYWWWTANTVFEKLSHTQNHKGMFVFMHDDLFLTKDFIYMMLLMKQTSSFVLQCDFVTLETAGKYDFAETRMNAAEIKSWDPKQHYSVLAFDARVWSSISAHYYYFCNVDDYFWAHSLFYLSLNRKDNSRFKVISSVVPRAFKTNQVSDIYSGIYGHFFEYRMLDIIYKVLEMQKKNRDGFFPPELEVFYNIELEYDEFVLFDFIDSNGGWNDPRDKELCYNITVKKIDKIIMDMNSQFNHYKNDEEIDYDL